MWLVKILHELFAKVRGSQTATLTLWLLVSQLLAAGVSFVVNIIAAYGLDPDQRGLLAFYLQIGYLFTTFLLLGTEKPFLANVQARFSPAVALLLRIVRPSYIIIAVIFVGVLGLYAFGFTAIAAPIGLVAVFIICNQHLRIVRAAYITSGDLRPFLTVITTTNVLTLAFAVLLAVLQHGNFLTWLLAYVVANVIATVYVAKSAFVARDDEIIQLDLIRAIQRQGLRLLPASLGNITLFRPDRLLLPLLASPAALGVYIVVSAALEVAVWPVQQWSDSKMRQWQQTRPFANPRLRLTIVSKAALGVLGIALACSAVLVPVVLWVLPDEYNASLMLILPITCANILFGASRAQQGIAISGNRSGLVSTAEVSGLLVSVGAYIVLIPLFGGMGAAVGSIIGNSVCFAVTELGIWLARPAEE